MAGRGRGAGCQGEEQTGSPLGSLPSGKHSGAGVGVA